MITLGDQALLGGFIALAGGAASVLRRHTDWSLPGTLVIASLLAGLAATLVLEPAQHVVEETRTDDAARLAYVAALNGQDPDVLVEGRGPGAVTAWFTLSQEVAGECGRYPPPEVRAHLAELRFLRVVVAERNRMGGLCSFPP